MWQGRAPCLPNNAVCLLSWGECCLLPDCHTSSKGKQSQESCRRTQGLDHSKGLDFLGQTAHSLHLQAMHNAPLT